MLPKTHEPIPAYILKGKIHYRVTFTSICFNIFTIGKKSASYLLISCMGPIHSDSL